MFVQRRADCLSGNFEVMAEEIPKRDAPLGAGFRQPEEGITTIASDHQATNAVVDHRRPDPATMRPAWFMCEPRCHVAAWMENSVGF